MNIISVEWRQKGLRKERGWEAAFPGAEGFEGPWRRSWGCVWCRDGNGEGAAAAGSVGLQVRHLIFTWFWVSN